MNEQENFRIRIALIQAFLRKNACDGVLLSRADNFAMATGGKRNYVSTASDLGASSLFVTKDGRAYFIGNNIEAPRVMEEELAGLDCEAKTFLWFESNSADCVRKEFGGTLVSDDGSLGANIHDKLAGLRALLTSFELDKYRRLGALAAEAMTATVESIQAGDMEADIAARLAAEGAKRRCVVPVRLVAADVRIDRYRHPLPTEQPLLSSKFSETRVRGYVMVVAAFLKEGLVASMTRFKRVGDIPDGVPDAYARMAGVDVIMQEASQPGKTLGDVFAACQRAYTQMGFPPDEWHHHHQGGTTGYAGRTFKATPGHSFPILDPQWSAAVKEIAGMDVDFGQAFAWNPSATGVKSEDTFILLPDGTSEIVTRTPQWPNVDLEAVLRRKTAIIKSGIAGL